MPDPRAILEAAEQVIRELKASPEGLEGALSHPPASINFHTPAVRMKSGEVFTDVIGHGNLANNLMQKGHNLDNIESVGWQTHAGYLTDSELNEVDSFVTSLGLKDQVMSGRARGLVISRIARKKDDLGF